LTPTICVKDANAAIEFYKRAFGAEEAMRMPAPDGRIAHAEIVIGDSRLMLSDPFPEHGAEPAADKPWVSIHLYTPDCDAVFDRAVEGGAKVAMPLMDAFWGDRYGKLVAPFGVAWSVSTHIRDVSPEEMQEAAKK